MFVADPGFCEAITVYSRWKDGRDEVWVRTQIAGVSWYGRQGVNISDAGLVTADQYTVRIPNRSLAAYVAPHAWNAMKNPPSGIWTAQSGDVVVKGLAYDEVTTGIAQITGKYQDSFVVTGVYDNRRVAFKHLRVEGK